MQKKRSFLPLLIVLLVVSALLVLGSMLFVPQLHPFSQQVRSLQEGAFGITSSPFAKDTHSEQLDAVSERVAFQVDQAELHALRDQFEIESPSSRELLPARIIGYQGYIPGVSRPREIVLAAGERDGVKVGQAVVFKEFLVGQVIKVTPARALVALLTKSDWSFTAVTSETQADGLVNIDGGDIFLQNVVLSERLEEGDLVLTKGSEDVVGTGFPPELVVGTIVSLDKKASSLFQTAKIESPLEVVDLTTVFVVVE